MADADLTGGIRPVTYPSQIPNAAAARIAGKLLNRHSPHEIAEAVEVLIDVLDMLGGDPDAELGGDEQDASGDESDYSVAGWTPGRHGAPCEDDEDDDPAEEDNEDCDDRSEGEPMFGRRDCARLNRMYGDGPGCEISDPDSAVDDRPCDWDEGF